MSAEKISSKIWKEVPEADNPFAASVCYCSGFDVYGEVLPKAGWIEYLYLLLMGERPSIHQTRLLELLAIALANPGPRDLSVRAAMNGAVGGSNNASNLIAALAVGAGGFGGSRELVALMQIWSKCGQDIDLWSHYLANPPKEERRDDWMHLSHVPGFDPYGASRSKPVQQILDCLASVPTAANVKWLQRNVSNLETAVDMPLSMIAVVAAACIDLSLDYNQGEMLYLMLRLPGAAVHALEQKKMGWRKYPFFGDAVELLDYPHAD